jgi:glutathione S-transferase
LEDGRQLAQSLTILRYLARKFGLCGQTEMETAKCNEYIDAMSDIVKGI